MLGFVYLIWVSLPLILFVLGSLYWLIELLLPQQQPDTFEFPEQRPPERKSKLFFAIARLMLFAAILALLFDNYLLKTGKLLPLHSPNMTLAVWMVFPVSFLIAVMVRSFLRILRPNQGFDKMKVETRGTNPAFTVIAIIIFCALVMRKPSESSDYHKGDKHPSSTISSSSSPPKESSAGAMGAISDRIGGLKEEFLALFGVPKEQPVYVPRLSVPDFHQEGFILFHQRATDISRENGVEPALVQALIEISSGYNSNFQSADGSGGLLPLSDDIAKSYGARNIFDPEQNLLAGVKYLESLLQAFPGNTKQVIAAFRFGKETEKDENLQSPEVQKFVEHVMTVYEITKAHSASAGDVDDQNKVN